MITKILDANILVRFLVETEGDLFEQSCQIFSDLKQRKYHAHITEGVIFEAFFVLTKTYNTPKITAVKKLQEILKLPTIITSEKILFIDALQTVVDHNIDFIDALLLEQARIMNYELVTFDKKLKKLATK